MNELDRIKKEIDKNDVISFDIFDTLLLRNVQKPVDIFKIMAKEIEEKYDIEDFFNKRIETENNTRTVDNNYETTLDDIYENFPSSKKNNEIFKKMELDIENRFLIANPFMKKVFDYAKEKGKKIICISDMYLPLSFLEKKLKDVGYGDVKIYLSCVCQKHKGDCSLFEYVYNEEKIDKKKWLHIGDNKVSDYDSPISIGINAYHYGNVLSRSIVKDSDSIESSIINAISNNTVNNGLEIPYWEKFGVLYASPIYFAFANWVYQQNKDRDNVCFLARDGYMIKKVFDKILKKDNNKLDSLYIYTSRRGIQLPALVFESKRYSIDVLTSINWNLNEEKTIRDILKYFSLDESKYENMIMKYGFNSIDDVITKESHDSCKQFVSDIYDDIRTDMKEQIELIKKYFSQENFDKYSRLNIVDIGWRGSVQYSLSKIFDDIDIFGYYLCTNDIVYDDIFYNTKGFIANFAKPADKFTNLMSNVMMFEFLLSSPDGSLRKFEEKNGKVVPVLGTNDEYNEQISILQKSSLDIIDSYLEYYDFLRDYSSTDCVNAYLKYINNRKYNDLIEFSKLSTNAGYGEDCKTFVPIFRFNDISRKEKEFVELIDKSYWNNTFLIKEANNEEEYLNLKNKLMAEIKKQYHKDYSLFYRIKRKILKKIKVYVKKMIESSK